jgi:DNA sulfur modification protein DndB
MDNIVTSEDDGNAIVTRWLLEPEPPADLAASPISKWARGMDAGIIDFRKLNCTQSDATLYSLKTIYEAVRTILAVNGTEDFDEKRRIVRPSDLELRAAYGVCVKWWATLLAASPALLKINVDQRQVVREKRSDSEQSLLMTQMGLLACIRAASLIRDRSDAADELIALEAVASLSWQRSDDRWRGILINNAGGMISNQGNIRIAARLQAMRAAPNRWSEEEKLQLQAEVRELRADPRWTLSLN